MNYIARETLIAAIINTVFSVGFFTFMFRGSEELVLGPGTKLTLDFLPQAFFVSLFSALPPTLLTLKRLKTGHIKDEQFGKLSILPGNLFIRIALFAITGALLFGGCAVLLCSQVGPVSLTFETGLGVKAAFGALISLIIAPIAIRSALAN